MIQEKFGLRLKRIVDELVNARGYIGVWEQLWPTNENIVRVENRYRSFFGFVRMSLNNQFFLSLSKIVEQRSRNENLSIWRLLEIIETDPKLVSKPLDLDNLKRVLKEKQDLLKRIVDYRDKELAHIDDSYLLNVKLNKGRNKKVKILLGEVKVLQKDLEEIVNEICGAYDNSDQDFETIEHDDTTRLLDDLIKWLDRERLERENEFNAKISHILPRKH
jgi:hypothetical protein